VNEMNIFKMIIREIKSFLFAGKSGRHFGIGLRQARKGFHKEALKHFFIALECDEISSTVYDGRDPVVLESIARSYASLNEYDQAKKYAEESLTGYQKLQNGNNPKDIFFESVKRTEKLIEDILSLQ